MAAINELLEQVPDQALRVRLEEAIARLSKNKKFGLVFEEHIPECTPLYGVGVKPGITVARKAGQINKVFTVLDIEGSKARCYNKATRETEIIESDELVAVAQFGEPIFPMLQPIDEIQNAPDSPLWHTLIEADNYHALQLLEYLYAGKVDCIYIDPPYNTGARDWKYNNDYVDGSDSYRHSKWLSMMEKRLKLAKKLLNPAESVLIVTIDEKEYLHLGCLLEDMFSGAKMQMISSVINPAGAGKKEFARTDEYIFFIRLGTASIVPESREVENVPVTWDTLRRSSLANARGKHGKGACGPNQFYPIYVNDSTGTIEKIGEPIAEGIDRNSVPTLEGCTAVFPVRPDGTEMNWGIKPDEAKVRLKHGYLRAGAYKPNEPQKYVISYLTGGIIKDIETGIVTVESYNDDGSINAFYPTGKDKMPTTNWNRPTHDAQRFGTNILSGIIGNRFSYPKSLYAVKDSIGFFVKSKPSALIIDFFAGSGTTLHAVNLLNAEDGGHRRCIMVTNNEVSADEAKSLSEQGHRPGDEEWEKLGIARYVTWPRTVCSIEGHDVEGNPLKGDYLGSDLPMVAGFKANAAYFKLGFLDKDGVTLGRQFQEILPLLWLKTGAVGKRPVCDDQEPEMMVLPENEFAILVDETCYARFIKELAGHEEIKTIFFVTDSEDAFREMSAGVSGRKTHHLYREYIENFVLGSRRD